MNSQRMKILCVTDSFGSGGAQRQMVNLACGLKQRGHEVEFFIYFPQKSFFRKQVEELGIPIHEFQKGRGFSLELIRRLVSLIRNNYYSIVVSFLDNPNIYAELSSILSPSSKFVVSERCSHLEEKGFINALIKRNLHRLASHLVTNSIAHREWLQKKFPWLKEKVSTIYNGLDVRFYLGLPNPPHKKKDLKLIAVGRIGLQKNLICFIKALHIFQQTYGWAPSVSWVGRRETVTSKDREYCQQVDDLLKSLPEVKKSWAWLGERSDVPTLLEKHHALILPSFYEGLPNVVCEALAAGRPVLVSDVCDNALLVPDGERGFLFDPSAPETIAKAINQLLALKNDEWVRISKMARQYAETSLSIDRLVTEYEDLFMRLTNRSCE